jgi:homoserine/homoserine lactone efflux protein
MNIATWWIFACATVLICVTQGPNMLHVMTRSVRFGFAASTIAMAGCLSAVLICVTASSLGLGALLMASPRLFEGLRYVGAAYLLWLGWKSWTAPDEPSGDEPGRAGGQTIPPLAMFRTALFTGLSNPKLIVFAAAFFPQFIHADRPWATQFAILVATFATIEVCCYAAYAAGGRRLALYLSGSGRRRLFNRASGLLFGLFGFGLLAYRA